MRKTKQECQKEYNRIKARLGHMTNPVNIAAANRMLDRLALAMQMADEKAARREGPAERTRRTVYATGNKWAIENFDATH